MIHEHRIVYIEWDDIVQGDTGWRTPEDALDWAGSEPSIVNQIGFLLDKDEDYVTLVCSYLPPDFVGTVVRIPTPAIKYMKEFTIEQCKNIK